MNALQEVIHSARELVNEHRHAYPPVWAKDANKIIDEAAAELAALRARVGEAEAERDFYRRQFPSAAKNYAAALAKGAE